MFYRLFALLLQQAEAVWRTVVKTGTGLIVANDTTEGQPVDLQLQGWTKQNQYKGKNLFDLTDVLNDEGYVNSNFSTSTTLKHPFNVIEGNQYVIITKGHAVKEMYSSIYFGESDLKYEVGTPTTRVLNTGTGYSSFLNDEERVRTVVASKTCTITNVIIHSSSNLNNAYVVEELGVFPYIDGVSEKYEPYTGNQPSPSPEYPQEIVNAGKHNEETQKYEVVVTISDKEQEPTKQQTVTVTSDRPITKLDRLVEKDGVIGWEYGGKEIIYDGSDDEVWKLSKTENYSQFYIEDNDVLYSKTEKNVYCKYFMPSVLTDREEKDNIIYTVYGVAINAETLASDVDGWKNWLNTNPIDVLVRVTEPEFIPLPTEEQEAIKALKTYYPTTVFSNNDDMFMQVEYQTKVPEQEV